MNFLKQTVKFPDGHVFEAELHCILQNIKNGKFYDITPDILPTKTHRRIVLEPRVTLNQVIRGGVAMVENICSKVWDEMTVDVLSIVGSDFFELFNV